MNITNVFTREFFSSIKAEKLLNWKEVRSEESYCLWSGEISDSLKEAFKREYSHDIEFFVIMIEPQECDYRGNSVKRLKKVSFNSPDFEVIIESSFGECIRSEVFIARDNMLFGDIFKFD